MRPTRPGKYRHVVYVQNRESTRNPDGQWTESWVDFKKKFADKNPLKASEYFEAKAVNAIQTVNWKMRYDGSVDEAMRIVEKDKQDNIKQVYEIQGILDMEGLNREMEVITEAVVSSGS
ncbi:phage head closure protein [Lentibacillus salicampi]|uniref:Head-tail adaptor protein n=1 Tax=Lentibacillus salicampi TaxID=175306 RepID=A0A4Y9AB41_9BACI|nr:phage head closure protein [Lentibacillus salicampi]TFJ92140.1 head-tail adaptor protein [Lentibacillus salicampi]